jgi:hypothetical protein
MLSLTHNTSACTSPYKCKGCSNPHHEWEHTYNDCKITHTQCPYDKCTNCSKEYPADSKLCSLRKVARGITLCPKPTLTRCPPTNQTETISMTHTHQNLNNHKTSYLYNALLSVAEFNKINNRKAVECIYMILPISTEEVKQENLLLHIPHNWHDVATTIIKKYSTTYIDDTNINEEDY